MKQKPTLTLGKTLWVVKAHSSEPQEAIITKIGSKYFEIDVDSRAKYCLNSWQQENNSSYKGQVYETLQEILDEREYSKLKNVITRQFQSFHSFPFTLDQVRRIVAIIQEPKETQ